MNPDKNRQLFFIEIDLFKVNLLNYIYYQNYIDFQFGFGVNINNSGKIRAVMSNHNHDSSYYQSTSSQSFNDDKLLKNFNTILEVLEKEKSNNTLKGDLIKNTFITSTMGVSYKIKLEKSI